MVETIKGKGEDSGSKIPDEKPPDSGSFGKADSIWHFYKRVIVFPSATDGLERQLGIALYLICFILAFGFVIAMFYGSMHTYTDYKMESGSSKSAVVHQIPDIVACPVPIIGSGYQYNVPYNYEMIGRLKMKPSEVNLLTEKKFKTCPPNAKCTELKELCKGSMEKYCIYLDPLIQEAKTDGFSYNESSYQDGDLFSAQKALLFDLWYENGKRWNLEMLWVAIQFPRNTWIHKRYPDYFGRYHAGKEGGTWSMACFIFGAASKRQEARKQCREAVKPLWIGNSFCSYISGSLLNKSDTPYVGFNLEKISFMKFWLGSLETMEINEESFISNLRGNDRENMPTASGVIHYSMTKMVDTTGVAIKCQKQSKLRGINLECHSKVSREKWFYDFNYQNRRIQRVWIYAKTKQTVTKRKSFTKYTQFQFAASLFSCCLGLSIMQVLQILFTGVNRWAKLRSTSEKAFRALILIGLFGFYLALTTVDIVDYFNTRYSTVFKEKDVDLQVPMVQICNDAMGNVGFVNVTKFSDYNVSLEFFVYLRHVGYQHESELMAVTGRNFTVNETNGTESNFIEYPEWMIKNMGIPAIINCSKTAALCNVPLNPIGDYMLISHNAAKDIDYAEHLKFSKRIRAEAQRLSKLLGYDYELSIGEITQHFYLDPARFVKHCSIGNTDLDCSQHISYMYEMGYRETCLVFKMDKATMSPGFSIRTGIDEALKISVDVKEFIKHSDVTSYYGPGTEELKQKNLNEALCKIVAPEKPNWWKLGCYSVRSWKLKIAHPDWYNSFNQILLPNEGLTVSGSHIAEIRSIFDERLPKAMSNCTESEPKCSYPAEEMTHIFKAVQYEIWCGCSFCFDEGPKIRHAMEIIMGKPLNCCSATALTHCYSHNLKEAMRIGFNYTDNVWKTHMLVNLARSFDKSATESVFSKPLKWRNAKKSMLSRAIYGFNKLDSRTKQRMIAFTRSCFDEPCQKYMYELLNYQNEKINDGFVNVTIFYESREGVGTEEIDRLDPAQFVGMLMCSYSVTFGIGILGLIELVYIVMRRMRGSVYGTTKQVIDDHLIRSGGVWTKSGSVSVHPDNDTAIISEFASTDCEKEDKPKKQESLKIIDVETLTTDVKPSLPEKEKKPRKKAEKSQEDSSEHESNGGFMILILILVTLAMLLLLMYFFATVENQEYNADILSSPAIHKPSVILCAVSKAQSKALYEALGLSVCRVPWGMSMNCHSFFKMYAHNRKDRFCYIWDNTRTPPQKLDQTKFDLVLEASETMPDDILISVQGLNRTRLDKLTPYLKWTNQSLQMSYTTKLRRVETNCQDTTPEKKLETCSENPSRMNHPHYCAMKPSQGPVDEVYEPLMLQNPCYWFRYGIALSFSELIPLEKGGMPMRLLKLKPSQNNVLVFSVKSKHDFTRLLSIVGGFFGSFIEVTVLSFFSIVVFILTAVSRKKPD